MRVARPSGSTLEWLKVVRYLPFLFLIFMNALMDLMTERGKRWNVSHGIEGTDQINNIGFVDDCSFLAQCTGGMQALMDIVQEFEE